MMQFSRGTEIYVVYSKKKKFTGTSFANSIRLVALTSSISYTSSP